MATKARVRTAAKHKRVQQAHPAEAGGVAAAVALLVAKVAGVHDVDTIAAIGIVVGFVPAAVTWVVNLVTKP